MNMVKLNGYYFSAVNFLTSAPLLGPPGEWFFYSSSYHEYPAHSVTYLECFLNFKSWAQHFTYIISFNLTNPYGVDKDIVLIL